jgi:hypothetical protein
MMHAEAIGFPEMAYYIIGDGRWRSSDGGGSWWGCNRRAWPPIGTFPCQWGRPSKAQYLSLSAHQGDERRAQCYAP